MTKETKARLPTLSDGRAGALRWIKSRRVKSASPSHVDPELFKRFQALDMNANPEDEGAWRQWNDALKSIKGLPARPPFLTEQQYAHFLFGSTCTHCRQAAPQMMFWKTFARVCHECAKNKDLYLDSSEVPPLLNPRPFKKQDYIPYIFTDVYERVTNDPEVPEVRVVLCPTKEVFDFVTRFNPLQASNDEEGLKELFGELEERMRERNEHIKAVRAWYYEQYIGPAKKRNRPAKQGEAKRRKS